MLEQRAEDGTVKDLTLQQAAGRALLHQGRREVSAQLRVALTLGSVGRLVGVTEHAVNAGLEGLDEDLLDACASLAGQ